MTDSVTDSEATVDVLDVEEPEEVLVEEISIDGMCGVY
jgi:mycofactocin precursor